MLLALRSYGGEGERSGEKLQIQAELPRCPSWLQAASTRSFQGVGQRHERNLRKSTPATGQGKGKVPSFRKNVAGRAHRKQFVTQSVATVSKSRFHSLRNVLDGSSTRKLPKNRVTFRTCRPTGHYSTQARFIETNLELEFGPCSISPLNWRASI